MEITERRIGEVTILDMKGKMTIGEGDEVLKSRADTLIFDQGCKQLILNTAQVPYIDSCGFAEIVRTLTNIRRLGGDLRLLNPTKRIMDMMAITKMLSAFEICESEFEAVSSFGTPPTAA